MRSSPSLMVITDSQVLSGQGLIARIEFLCQACRPGTLVVQLRDKQLGVRERLDLGHALLRPVRRHGHRLVVNDRIDLAMVLDADGVHRSERGVPADELRRTLGPKAWLSSACHRLSDLTGPGVEPLDALILSPIVAARKGRDPLGVAALGPAREALDRRVRLLALGGIDASSAAACLQAGADGVAVIGAALAGGDPAELVRALGLTRVPAFLET